MAAKKLLVAVGMLALVALAAAGPPLDKKERNEAQKAERKAAAEQRRAEFEKKRPNMNKERGERPGKNPFRGKDEARKERMTPEIMEERRKASALFAAIVTPTAPKDVTFPLDEENLLKFHSAREGLMEHVHTESKGFDLKNEDTKKSLREKTTSNQEETRKLLVAAVKAGKTLQQARVGLIIAQFEALDPKVQEEATKKGKERMEKMPAGARDKASNRQLEKHKEELAQLSALKTDAEKEEWLNKKYKPSVAKVPKMLQ